MEPQQRPVRPIYLNVYHQRLFAAHWALWIPAYNSETQEQSVVGKRIEVEGDARDGFRHSITRNHDVSRSRRLMTQIFLGWTFVENVVDGTNEGIQYIDNNATDVIEQWALYIPAPGPSMRRVAPASSSTSYASTSYGSGYAEPTAPPRRVQLENCQTWLRTVVEALVTNEILNESALQILDDAPKN